MDSSQRWLDEEEQIAWRSYLRASCQVFETLDRALQPMGTSLSEYEILAILSEVPGGSQRMSVIADIAVQSRSRLTHTASRMERRGWVCRRPVPDDKRGVELCLTAEGHAVLDAFARAHVDSVRQTLVDPLGRADFLVLGELMRRIRDRLSTGGDGRPPTGQ
ncbi:MarR family winged helix-turn-helix transcriptional regulator [Austwickia sp. TVS 96-490-7B]|uniref:MarR family winged helix-turn-helix transcriptional regulator n=1 Tax=Austwickia sp. TVS 96-490-7B TaxID=2830843 RepID=UPI001C5A17AB|nr:MarR family transcriptional regulator [Austwickia sp. TVS 96-490-7B]